MSDREVAKFMVGISLDAAALQRFHADPDTELSRYGLSQEAANVIKGKNSQAIHKAITDTFSPAAADDVVNVVVVVL